MTMDLFITPAQDFEKTSSEVALSEDPNSWPNEILQELYRQVPYISDFEPNVIMDRVKPEQGYAFGHVEVMNKTEIQRGASQEGLDAAGIRQVRIPVIVREHMLQPFDVVVTDDAKMLPLTESRLRQAIFRPSAFDITGRTPGDMSMIGQLYPPYRQNYGFGGGGATMSAGMGKEGQKLAAMRERMRKTAVSFNWVMDKARSGAAKASPDRLKSFADKMDTAATRNFKLKNPRVSDLARAGERTVEHATKKASLLAEILPTINEADYLAFTRQLQEDPSLRAAYVKNAAAMNPSVLLLSQYRETSRHDTAKVASAMLDLVKPTVVQVRRGEDGYVLKTASHRMWAPLFQNIDRGELVRRFGEKVALATDTSGGVTMADDTMPEQPEAPAMDGVDPEADRPELIHDFGLYKVQDSEGRELVGFVLPNLIDLDGAALPLALFTNGSQAAIQGEIVGVRAGEGKSLPSADAPSGNGCFYQVLPNGRAQATVPMEVQGGLGEGETGAALVATTFDGRQVELHLGQPNLERITEGPNGDVLVPASFKWLPLGEAAEVELVSDPTLFGKAQEAKEAGLRVEIRAGGPDSFSLSGFPVDKLAESQRAFLSSDDAVFILAGLGIDPAHAYTKLARAMTGERPEVAYASRALTLAGERQKEAHAAARTFLEALPDLRRNLVKEAAGIPDPMAVDTVLSLGFINPENLTSFVSSLPKIEEAQQKLCELLMAARLGMQEVPTSPLEKAIRAVEDVLEGLKILAFQKPVGE